MADIAPLDPYRSPSLPEKPYAGSTSASRPQLLSALCIICIVIGVLGLFNSFTGTVGAIAGPTLQTAFQPKMGPGIPPEMQKAQDDFQADINAVNSKYFIEMVVSLSFRFLAAVLLLVGGIMALMGKESGRRLLVVACAVALIFELGHAIMQTIINTEMMTAVNSYIESLLQSIPQRQGDKPFKSFIQSFTNIVIYVSIGGFYVLTLAKGAVYLFGLIYLRKPKIRELFQPAKALS